MIDLRFSEDEITELENHKESIRINGSLTILEDDYEQKTIWRRKLPTKRKPVYIVTKIEKIANKEMKIINDFIKKYFQGRFCRKPRNIDYLLKI
jgi:hypothetical protein